MEQIEGVVKSIRGGSAQVLLDRKSMCGESCGGCHLCDLKGTVISAKNAADAKENDRVLVEMNTDSGLLAAFLAYGIPLIFVLIGIFLIASVSTYFGTVFLAVLLVGWYTALFLLERKGKLRKKFGAQIVRRL